MYIKIFLSVQHETVFERASFHSLVNAVKAVYEYDTIRILHQCPQFYGYSAVFYVQITTAQNACTFGIRSCVYEEYRIRAHSRAR